MTYLSGKRETRKSIVRYGFYGVIFFLVVFFWSDIKKTVYPVVEPVVIVSSKIKNSIGSIPDVIVAYSSSRETLIESNAQMSSKIEQLENELQEKTAELQELRQVKEDVGDVTNTTTLVLYPLMQDITKLYSTILLSKGFKDGVEVGEYVFIRGMQPVCTIVEVYNQTSLCQLLTSDEVSTDAVVLGSTTVMLSLTGRGGGTFLANVPRDTPITVGDAVFLRSNQLMKLGTVVDVIHNDQDTSWHVFVTGTYNPVTASIFYIHKK